MTSRDVVNIVQRRVKQDKIKVGHTGTLDPLAEGVLVLGVGPAVRLVPYVQHQTKYYRARFRLGQSSQSGDLEGDVTHHRGLPVPTLGQIRSAAVTLLGEIRQTPPAHSAIWVDGKRAHRRIRDGETVTMPARTVRVDSIHVRHYEFPELELDIVCGSGTYIRTLGTDLAVAAGSTAVMAHLRRLAVGDFAIEDSVSIEQLRDGDLSSMLLPAAMGVRGMPRVTVTADQSTRLGHGLCISAVPAHEESDPPAAPVPEANRAEAAALTDHGELRAILRQRDGRWCPYRVFPISG